MQLMLVKHLYSKAFPARLASSFEAECANYHKICYTKTTYITNANISIFRTKYMGHTGSVC